MRVVAAAGAVALALAGTACGARHGGPPDRGPGWRAAAVAVLRQLQSDVVAAEVGGTSTSSASRALRNLSDMYALSFAFTDLGGCRAMVARAGSPPNVARELAHPCTRLERAAALFTRAVTHSQPGALVRATRQVQLAEPSLVRALARLRPA
jgi:hypothetical protein